MANQTEEDSLLFDNFDFIGFDEDTEIVSTKPTDTKSDNETKTKKEVEDPTDDEFFEENTDDDSELTEKEQKAKTELDEEDKEDTKKKEAPSDDDSSSSFLQVLAKSLFEEGVLSSFDDKTEIKKASDFIELINQEIIENVDAYKNDLPEEIKTLIEHYEEGVPLADLLKTRIAQDEYKRIDADKLEDNEDLMKKLIHDDLIHRGFDEDEITDEIKNIFALDNQEARSKKALARLIKREAEVESTLVENEQKRQAAAVKKQNEDIKNIRKAVEDTTEFAGISLSKQHKKEAFDTLMKEAGQVNGRPVNAITKAQIENPADFQKNLALAWTLTKGFSDWSVFGKATKSKTMVDLEEQARRAAEKIRPGGVVKGGIQEQESTAAGSFLTGLKL